MKVSFSNFSKESRLTDLAQATQFCNLCERMRHRDKILSNANGCPTSKVLFIAEAPGRLGADRTGVPLHGDKTGNNFETLLGNIGWKRDDIFITNALLCNPRQNNGTNGTPTIKEIRNCSIYLEMIINLVDPLVIVSLGRVALEALSYIQPHGYSLLNDVAKTQHWAGRILVPLYHPGPRAMVHRSFAKQTADFYTLAKIMDPIKGLIVTKQKKAAQGKIYKAVAKKQPKIQQVINVLVDTVHEMSYFKLVKLLYFIDLFYLQKFGISLTGEVYLRQQEGPWLPKLRSFLTSMKGYELDLFFKRGRPFIRRGHNLRLTKPLKDDELEIIAEVINKYGDLRDGQLKTAAYLSKPMRYVLKQEKKGRKMRNVAIIYKNKTIRELDNEKIG